MSIEITLKFANVAEAQAALEKLSPREAAPAKPAQQAQHAPAANTQQAAPTNGTGVVAQPAQAGTAMSLDDVNNAFRGYLAKGQGRTAATGMAILKEHGLASVKQARPEQYGVLKAAFEAAGPENPLGKAA